MGFRDKLHNIRMWGTRRRWAKEAETVKQKERQDRDTIKATMEATCEKAADKTKKLCGNLIKEANLNSAEEELLVHGLETKIISTRSAEKTQIASDLQTKGLLDRLPMNPKTPLITRFVMTGKGNCVAKLESGESVSECDCSTSAVIGAAEQWAEKEQKKKSGYTY